ncbi:hypothetical protein LGZ99_02890 [Photorhabdus temperata]|uniref:Uncharacterized protein n=1 Tax=Photorhabdus temperata J3 TaxID=1389415 RepID=U7QYI7_PHOTE|nr:hypothetical protein [Photorhabdus temperata]ERT13134.1 hypothetical protein O185_10530 [Photorhabdus temperata J3]MCT8346187.1 hypothetical protein [Photorhabdus temperata]
MKKEEIFCENRWIICTRYSEESGYYLNLASDPEEKVSIYLTRDGSQEFAEIVNCNFVVGKIAIVTASDLF